MASRYDRRMRRKLAPRINCVICNSEFPQRGGKRTCSDYCRATYARQRRRTPPKAKKKPSRMWSMEYIIDRVKITSAGCWEWQLSCNPKTGYGQIGLYPYTAHKLAFHTAHGRPPVGVVRHLCHNKRCCNPDHLREGTVQQNWNDSRDKHEAAAQRRRGRPPKNRIPVTVGGVSYPSKSHALKDLRVSWQTLNRLIASAPVSRLPSKQTLN